MQGYAKSPSFNIKYGNQQPAWLIIVAMFVAVFAPTSIGGVINPLLIVFGNTAALGVFLFAAIYFKLRVSPILLIVSLLIMALLILMTFLSPFQYITPGAFMPYLTLALVCSVKVDNLKLNIKQQKFLFILIAIVAALCFMAFFRVAVVMDIQEAYYQMFPDLYKFMMKWANKPVLMFATHSVAGFAYYLIAFCLFSAYLSKKQLNMRWMLLVMSLAYSVVLILLLSNTGFVLFLILLMIYIFYFIRYGSPRVVFFLLIVVLMLILYFIEPITNVINATASIIFDVLSKKENGLLARFSTESRLGGSIEYLIANPLVGVGVTSGGNIAFGDSFYAEYMLRLSFFGFFLVAFVTYGYLYLNIHSTYYFIMLASLVFIADLGYPLFVTYRFIFLFPVVIIFFNTITRQHPPESGHAVK